MLWLLLHIFPNLIKKSEKCIFVGYSLQSKAYTLYNPISGKVIISRDVKLNEEENWIWSNSSVTSSVQIPEAKSIDTHGNNSSTSSHSTLQSSP